MTIEEQRFMQSCADRIAANNHNDFSTEKGVPSFLLCNFSGKYTKGGVMLGEMVIADKVFQEPRASELEKKRVEARISGGRLVYDCFNAKVHRYFDEYRVKCKYSSLGRAADGSLNLNMVLKGIRPTVCQTCAEYDDGSC